ncbi:hypothetical protein [Glycomyces paridis]|uniref:CopG family transcriptional regulator n=1 Tax=Glycomyces paridis TaxID=2126555 RepID=A0A4S8PEB6_9ACTN|nr:hypothetical protein [Glycomyces paridis]THV27602.1 hypothetical protein E9998_14455 [Glycomyces paridis]
MSDDTISEMRRGEGPAVSVSASLHRGTVNEVRRRVGKRAFSAYLEDALLKQMRREDLRELLDDHIERHGEFSAGELAEAHDALYGEADEMRGHAA